MDSVVIIDMGWAKMSNTIAFKKSTQVVCCAKREESGDVFAKIESTFKVEIHLQTAFYTQCVHTLWFFNVRFAVVKSRQVDVFEKPTTKRKFK